MGAIKTYTETELADELCFPTDVPGVYALSRASTYRGATEQPRVAFAPTRSETGVDDHRTERLEQALLSRIAAPGCVAVIPSSCTEFGRKSLRLAEWPAVSGYLELCTRARAAHLVSLRVTKCRAWTKNNVFCSKVYAVAEAEIEVYRPGCTEPVLSKMEKQAMEAKRWFEPNEDKCLAMLNLCTKRLAEKISADVLDAIGCGPEAEAQAAEKGGRAAQPKQAKGR